ncbi:MAG: NTF2-like N-terminal transpeptidase domain-containing protein [Ktedonobacterales bacterium]
MNDTKRHKELAEIVARRRRELGDRPDISQRMRKLSESSGHNPIGPRPMPRKTLLTILAGGLAAVALVACIATAIAVTAGGLWFQGQLSDPSTTIQKYYTALHQQDYAEAYSLFSPHLKTQISQNRFTDQYSSLDQIKGVVDTYPILNSTTASATATFTIAVVRRGDKTTAQVETIRLVKDGSDWDIDSIIESGTVPAPSPTS